MQHAKRHCTQELFANSFTSRTPNPQLLLLSPAAAFHPLGLLLQRQSRKGLGSVSSKQECVRSSPGLVDAVGCAPQQPLCRAPPRHLLQHNCHNMLGSREAAGTRLLNGRQRMKKQKGTSNRARQACRGAFPCTPPPDSFTRSPRSP